ncbi:MAG: molecular chaperone HtpG [Saprospiraceae bacterium]|nr:molecular chaperone HtpG [Saprospiraceae bacterium]
MQKGNISVQTENIFPIIKQFLYSDQEIFLRELVSNAVDATTKLKALARKGEFTGEVGDTTIDILLDEKAGTLTIRDRGIGMTEEEVQKYLNQVAFSSAAEFLEKYKDDSGIIGHFGLGFYSALMVAAKVEAISKSFQDESKAVVWTCEGNPEYTIDSAEKEDRGTDIVLHIGEEHKEYLEKNRIEELLLKYCKFLPVTIRFGTKEETITEGEGEEAEQKSITVDNIINNPEPIWKKKPTELTDEDYKRFYSELYPYSMQRPMFWIHLNIDFPFNLTGVLYFPQVSNGMELQKNKIQLYSNQVYVTDNVSDIVPEFLTLLHGVIDSPDIPLNVSRSYLQADGNVKKITGYITKKVAEKLNDLFKEDRGAFEEKWNDLSVFVKYGMITEDKFYDRAQKFVLLKNVDNSFSTLQEYKETIKANQTDKHDRVIHIYTNNTEGHHAQVESAKAKGYDVLVMDHAIDNHFMQQLEQKEEKITFVRVDSDTTDKLVQKDEEAESVLNEDQEQSIKAIFEKTLGDKNSASIELRPLSPNDQPVSIIKPEFMRRMQEMQAIQGMDMGGMPEMYNVVVNSNHELIAQTLLNAEEEEKQNEIADYLYNLALLNQGMLKGAKLSSFVSQSLSFLKG